MSKIKHKYNAIAQKNYNFRHSPHTVVTAATVTILAVDTVFTFVGEKSQTVFKCVLTPPPLPMLAPTGICW